MCIRISDHKLEDQDFPGFSFIVDFLSKLVEWGPVLAHYGLTLCDRYSDAEVVLKYAQWALEQHEELAAQIFTKRENALPLSPNQVLDFLSPFPAATVSYLEFIVHDQASKVCISV